MNANDPTGGLPSPPKERELPDGPSRRHELLAVIEADRPAARVPRWTVPLAAAAAVAAIAVTAAALIPLVRGHAPAEHIARKAAKSGLIDYKAPFIFRRDFETNFSVKWMHKDMGLMLESAQELAVPLFLTALSRQVFQAAITRGHGEEDICSTIKVLEEMTGIEVKS